MPWAVPVAHVAKAAPPVIPDGLPGPIGFDYLSVYLPPKINIAEVGADVVQKRVHSKAYHASRDANLAHGKSSFYAKQRAQYLAMVAVKEWRHRAGLPEQ